MYTKNVNCDILKKVAVPWSIKVEVNFYRPRCKPILVRQLRLIHLAVL